MICRASVAAAVLLLHSVAAANGVVEGIVANGTRPGAATSGVEVVLRAQTDGHFAVVAQTVTDTNGRFQFQGLPWQDGIVYLPGANLDGVHFPGPRVTLSDKQPAAFARVVVYESASSPNPLVVEHHEVLIRVEPGVISVREVLHLNNPSVTCYVGEPLHEGAMPVTVHLGIPKEFERVTFDTESWGRQFRIVNEKLVTSLPFPPGQRELGFRYFIPHAESRGEWRRLLSLPCRSTRVTIEGTESASTHCSLPYRTIDEDGRVHFESDNAWQSVGDVIEVEFGGVPTSMSHRVRGIAILIFSSMAIAVCIVALRHRNRAGSNHKASAP